MYSSALAGTQKPAPQLNVQGLGLGPPPPMKGALPDPTGVGALPVGAPGTTAKDAASSAIMALRTAQAAFPNLAPQLQQCIDALKAAAVPAPTGAPGGPAPLGQPIAPGTPPPLVAPTDLSGAP